MKNNIRNELEQIECNVMYKIQDSLCEIDNTRETIREALAATVVRHIFNCHNQTIWMMRNI